MLHRHNTLKLHFRRAKVVNGLIHILLDTRIASISIFLKSTILLIDEALVDNGCDLLLLSTALRLARSAADATYDTIFFIERLKGGLRLAALKVST